MSTTLSRWRTVVGVVAFSVSFASFATSGVTSFASDTVWRWSRVVGCVRGWHVFGYRSGGEKSTVTFLAATTRGNSSRVSISMQGVHEAVSIFTWEWRRSSGDVDRFTVGNCEDVGTRRRKSACVYTYKRTRKIVSADFDSWRVLVLRRNKRSYSICSYLRCCELIIIHF